MKNVILYIYMEKLSFITTKSDNIINHLTEKGFAYNYINKLLRSKDIKVDKKPIKENIIVDEGKEITVFYQPVQNTNSPKIEIIYEDDNILIINKPKGIEVEGENSLTKLLNAFAVHRLDRNTTGLMVFAKNKISQNILLDAFKNHNITKKYMAEVAGKANFKNKVFKAFLVKDSKNGIVKIFQKQVKGAKEIITIFNTVKISQESSLIECSLLTGRTHQIRASLAYLGYPIIGDSKYGKNEINRKFKEKSQKLHCFYLKFNKLEKPLSYLSGKEFVIKQF